MSTSDNIANRLRSRSNPEADFSPTSVRVHSRSRSRSGVPSHHHEGNLTTHSQDDDDRSSVSTERRPSGARDTSRFPGQQDVDQDFFSRDQSFGNRHSDIQEDEARRTSPRPAFDPRDYIPSEHRGQFPPGLDLNAILAIINATNANRNGDIDGSSSGSKTRSPDEFSGSKREALPDFIAQNLLVFRNNPRKFSSDTNKVNYAASYLRGAAFKWYRSHLERQIEPSWFHHWDDFCAELRTNFGELSPKAAAKRNLQSLRMREDERITDYLTKFQTYSNDLAWNDDALASRFYEGLAERLKDELQRIADDYEDYSLTQLQQKAINLDRRYWNRHQEKDRSRKDSHFPKDNSSRTNYRNKPSNSSGSTSTSSSSAPSRSKDSNRSKDSTNRYNGSSSSSSSSSPRKDLNLNKDGHIKEDERARRMKNNLCLYCGGSHVIADCPKRPDANRPVRQATATFTITPKVSEDNPPQLRMATLSELPPTIDAAPFSTAYEVQHAQFSDDGPLDNSTPPRSIVVNVSLPSGAPIVALIDTGSTDSYVSAELATQRGLTLTPLQRPLKISNFDGTTANNRPITHTTLLNLHFEDHAFYRFRVFVADLPEEHPIILGFDFCRHGQIRIDWENRRINFDHRKAPEPHQLRSATVDTDIPPPTDFHPDYLEELDYAPPATDKLKELVPTRYHDYLDVFSKEKGESLPEHTPFDLKIDLIPGSEPPSGGIYRLASPEQDTLRTYLDDMLAKGLIRPSHSSAASPVLFVPKKGGELRLCVDYRRLNNMTIKDRYPIPSTDMLLDQLSRATIYTKLDIRWAYHRVRVAEGHEWKTAFRTRYGLFEYLVMPFGLTNAPAVFQRLINSVFSKYLDFFVIVYLDDILVYSTCDKVEEHEQHVLLVLDLLRAHNLYAKADKCEFHTHQVEYLGFRITPSGVSTDPSKVDTITSWNPPTSVRQLRGFLGFANFYRRFIKGYATVAAPFYHLLRKDVPYNWDSACAESFDLLKKLFTSAPILRHFDTHASTRIETDASQYALGGVLLQQHNSDLDNKPRWHPVAFISRTLSPAERNYEVHDKELLGVVFACAEWRAFLLSLSQPFEVFVDNIAVKYFMSTKQLNRRQVRWAEFLADFHFVLVYRPGSKNHQADALSRRDDVFPVGDSSYAANNPENNRQFFQHHHLRIATVAPFAMDDLMDRLRQGQTQDTSIKERRTLVPQDSRYSFANGLLLFKGRILVPDDSDIKLRILQARHDHFLSGHPGLTKTLQILRRDFHWNGIREYAVNYIKSCATCIRNKTPRHKRYGELQPLPIPDRPWTSISMDFIDQLPLSHGFDAILVVVDRLTKMALFAPTTTKVTSEELATVFIQLVFSKHGVPNDIVSDRGSKFTSHFWRAFNKALNIEQKLSTAYHPETDGQTERVNQILETYLRHYVNYDQDNWSTLLPLAEFAYNNTPHSSTTLSPFFANKGYHPTLDIQLSGTTQRLLGIEIGRIQELHQHARNEIAKALEKNKRNADVHRQPAPNYSVGDSVFLSTRNIRTTRPTKKFSERRLGPFKITQVVSPLAMKLDLPSFLSSLHPVFHVSLLEPAHPDLIPGRKQPPPPPVTIDNHEEFEVNKILDSQYHRGKLRYLVEWTGYEDDDSQRATWEPYHMLSNAPELVTLFHSTHPDKPGPLPQSPPRTPRSRR